MARLTLSEIPTEGDAPSKFRVRNRDTDIAADPGEVPDPHTWPVPGAGDETLMQQLRWYLETFLSYPFEPYTQRAEKIEAALKAWGTKAFNALFNNRDAGSWIPTKAGTEFDLTISFDHPVYLAWPWEALHDPKTGYFGHRARIQRRLSKDAPDPADLPEDLPKDCIHILLITARPYKNDVDFRSISRPLVDLIRNEKLPATVEVLRPPTFAALRKHLKENKGRYHILHFDGHGGYGFTKPDPPNSENLVYLKDAEGVKGAEGRLLFEKRNGKADEISADKLATLLAGCGIPFVVLNACRSAALDQYAHEGSAFASVAGALVKAGFRGVLAMSHNLTVSGASVFLPSFYRELFASGNLLEATRAGRLEMVEKAQRSAWNPAVELKDWVLPVVYQQRDDFDLSFAADAQPPEPAFPMPEGTEHALVENFVGRDAAIQALERQWRKKAPAILAHGLGGIGKTTLALHFLQWLRDTGGLKIPPFWFSFDDIRSASHVFNQIGRAFAGAQFDGDQPALVAGLAKALKEKIPAVIVWDNFESARGFSAENTSGLLPDEDATRLKNFLAALHGGKTRVLITSRSDEDWLPKKHCHRLRLGGLRGEELWEYAAGIVEELDLEINRNDRKTRELLEKKLDGHPILVRAVLSQLEEGNIAALEKKVDAGLSELVGAVDESGPAHERLLGALNVVGDGLSEEERECLIPIALYERFVGLNEIHHMGEISSQIENYDRSRMEIVFKRLESAGLISSLYQNIFSIHPLLTSYFRTQAKETERDRELETRWQRAFVDFMGTQADHFAPKKLHEQRGVFSLHHTNFHGALVFARELQMEAGFATLTQSLASWALNTRDFAEARRLYTSLAERSRHLGNHKAECSAYHQLGVIAEKQRDFAGAEQWYLKSLAITEEQGDEHLAAITYHQLGSIAEEQRDFAGAEQWSLKSLAISEKQGDEHGAATTYHQLGSIAEEQQDFAAAEQWYSKSLAISEKQGDEHGAANTYSQLGSLGQAERDFAGAEQGLLKSLAIFEKQGDEHNAAIAYHELGIIAQEQRDFDGAETCYLKSLAIKEKQGNEYGAANTYGQLGDLARERHDFAGSEQWLSKSLAILEKQGNEHGVAITCHRLGNLAQKQRNFLESARFFLTALQIFVATDPHRARGTLGSFALLFAACSPEAAEEVRALVNAALGDEGMKQIEAMADRIDFGEDGEAESDSGDAE